MISGLLGVLVWFTHCDGGAEGTAPGSKPDSADTDSLRAQRVHHDLARLATGLARIPVPIGTRYFSAPAPAPAPKVAGARACRGEQDIFAIPSNPRGILGIDTVTYVDAQGIAHCAHQEPTLHEDHARYSFDPACGEAWERIDIEITPDDLLPRYRSHDTGRIRLITGLNVDIQAYDVDMSLDNSTGTPIFRSAHLKLATSDGHLLDLDLVISHPFWAKDFFPYWEDAPRGTPILGGPVRLGADTIGHAMLYGDHSLSFLDAAGNPVTPE